MNPVALANIRRMADDIRAMCGDDEQCFLDTLEGETDAYDIAAGLWREMMEAEMLTTGISATIETLKARKDRLQAGYDSRKESIGKLLRAAGVAKLVLPEVTLSVREGKPKLAIVDPDAIPHNPEFGELVFKPSKTAINEAFADADELPNWLQRTEPHDIVTARTK